jgi:hypothetical protein
MRGSGGFTNGLHFSGPKPSGKTNGLGVIRKGGFTNGMTNGRTNGRTNGHTNGRTNGRVNGRTNGRINGRINGTSNGRVNGLTNGETKGRRIGTRLGRVNGITNGFVNGAGAVNGFRLSYQQRSFISKAVNLRKRIVIIAVLVILVVATPYALIYSFPAEKVKIDGNFLDWMKAQIYKEVPDSDNPAIAIEAYAVKHDQSGSYFYIQTEGRMFTGINGGADAFYVFVDRDDNPETGYSVRGLGADFVTVVIGWNATIYYSDTLVFNSTASRADYAGFDLGYGSSLAFEDDKMEVSAPLLMTDRSQVLVLSRSTSSRSDWSDVNFRTRGASLEVIEDHDAPDVIVGTADRHVLSIEVSGKGMRATIETFSFDFMGNVTPVYIKAMEGQEMLGVSSNSTIDLIKPMIVRNGESRSIDILAEFPYGTSYGSFGLKLDPSKGMGTGRNVSWVIDTLQTGAMVSYLSAAPTAITIDGAFADWSTTVPITDSLGDAYSDRTDDYRSGDVDLRTVKTASSSDAASFYMSVNGTMLGGTSVPAALVRFVSPGPPAENITPALPAYGTDFAFVFLDTDHNQSTGYEIGSSEAAIAIVGKDNSIVASRVFKFVRGSWLDSGPAEAAIDSFQLEASVNYTALGMVPGESCAVTFMTQDWSGRKDDVAAALPARAAAGTRAFGGIVLNEMYVDPANKPYDWVEVYNTGTSPIYVGGWRIYADGVLVFTFPSITIQPGEFYVASGLNCGKSTDFLLTSSSGSAIDEVVTPAWQQARSYGRVGDPPYANCGRMNPTPGALNEGQTAIPEFGDLLLPITIMPITLFVIRRARSRARERNRRQSVD